MKGVRPESDPQPREALNFGIVPRGIGVKARERGVRFTNLYHHVTDVDNLRIVTTSLAVRVDSV